MSVTSFPLFSCVCRSRLNECSRRAAVFVILALACGCGGPQKVALRGGTEHLLLLHDRLLRYQERTGERTRTFTLRLLYAGGRSVRVYEAVFDGVDPGRCAFLSSGTQVFFETNRSPMALELLPEYRQLWVDEAAAVGDSWQDEDTGTETVFAGYETVTVPAGTYQNCYKTVTTASRALTDSLSAWRSRGRLSDEEYQSRADEAARVVVRWFASGVGLVKEQLAPDHVRELLAVVRPGTGLVDISSSP